MFVYRSSRGLFAAHVCGVLYAFGVLILLGLTPPAMAQFPSPGVVEESLRPPVPPARPPADPLPPAMTAPLPADIPAGGPRVTIHAFEFVGNQVFSNEALQAVIADRYGQALTLAEIYATADEITAFYQQHGYSVASATIPAQRVSDGRVRIEIIEGQIAGILFEGNQRYQDDTLHRHLSGIALGEVLRFDVIEREILLLNDLPGLVARSVIIPGEEYGTSHIRLRMEETRWNLRLSVDNHGPESVGQWRVGTAANLYNLSGRGDQLGLGITVAESNLLRQGRVEWSRPVGYRGGVGSLAYSRADYDVGGDFAALNMDGVSEHARLQYSYPLQRRRVQNLSLSAALVHSKGRSDLDGVPLTDASIQYLDTRLQFDRRLAQAFYSLSASFASNLRCHDDGPNEDAMQGRLALSGSFDYLLNPDWGVHLRSSAQLSLDPLPDSQQFSLGGPHSVRGFVPSRQRGDQGLQASAELRRYVRLEQADLSLRGFVDSGWVERIRPPEGLSRSDSLTAAGLGSAVLLQQRHQLSLHWAYALSGEQAHDDRSLYWVHLATTF
ncbi:ShlB/FhaC/HecB family hemolysin secretion/activation protein [Thiorhodospira sibirica]|uniref:ShlB/FhaC/HecB family hemolysin secretion/activation protein n=1 Tax=Thiorhodospira sibirica TaxID=154347 RepID=UPI00022C464A|nr:ShlB/FhaC/HecB family hemolysin secretion/activation protein [Thiorhodospira sibirica]